MKPINPDRLKHGGQLGILLGHFARTSPWQEMRARQAPEEHLSKVSESE